MGAIDGKAACKKEKQLEARIHLQNARHGCKVSTTHVYEHWLPQQMVLFMRMYKL